MFEQQNLVFYFAQALVDFGTISQEDKDTLYFTDSEVEAFCYITSNLTDNHIKNQIDAGKEIPERRFEL